jgi:hypothetical protein
VSDFFQEVDEEVRKDQLKQLWEKYSLVIIGAAVLVVLGIGAWRGYQWWELRKAVETGMAFEAAATLSGENKHAEAAAAFAKVATEGTAGYRGLARLREAAELAATDRPAAVKLYDAIAAESNASKLQTALASLRAGILLVDTVPYDEIQRRLEPLADPSGIYRHSAREMLALSAWRNNNTTETRRWVDAILSDGATPATLRSRIERLSAMIAPASQG